MNHTEQELIIDFRFKLDKLEHNLKKLKHQQNLNERYLLYLFFLAGVVVSSVSLYFMVLPDNFSHNLSQLASIFFVVSIWWLYKAFAAIRVYLAKAKQIEDILFDGGHAMQQGQAILARVNGENKQ